jgi:C1A family cysteine protease
VYVGGGDLIMKSSGKPDGHVMLIIGYDDTYGDNKGAVRLQNSWGDKGRAWVAYDTLEKLVEGTGFYAPESA